MSASRSQSAVACIPTGDLVRHVGHAAIDLDARRIRFPSNQRQITLGVPGR